MIKYYLVAIIFTLLAGFFYHYNWLAFLSAYWQRRKLIEFAEGVHAAVIQADIGKGKISNFIEEIVSEKLTEQEKNLAQEYQEAWQDKNRWQEFKEWESASLTDSKKLWAKK
ncbi:MAG: hypothetical protein GBAus27B_000148 [Mycoplasmataceae bacterium]|nr:MAG: hypothetical protein GBAus27B_000148 [Mycoplasmataceae bacterium]